MTMTCAPNFIPTVPAFPRLAVSSVAATELRSAPARAPEIDDETPLASVEALVRRDLHGLEVFAVEDSSPSWRDLERGRARFAGQFEHAGRTYVLARRARKDGGAPLSPREQQVVEMAARGLSNKEIGYELEIAISTVSVHLMNASAKLGVRSRTMLIRSARWIRADGSAHPPAAGPGLRAFVLERREETWLVFSFPAPPPSVPTHLSDAERDVVRLLLEGRSNAAIAQARGRSSRTVANQVASVLRKLRVGSRSELAAKLTSQA